MLEGLQKAIEPPSWALRLALGRQVGILHRFGLQVELLRALGASKLGSRGRFGPPSEPLWASKSYGTYRTPAITSGRQRSEPMQRALHTIGLLYLSIDLLLVALIVRLRSLTA